MEWLRAALVIQYRIKFFAALLYSPISQQPANWKMQITLIDNGDSLPMAIITNGTTWKIS
jgi:hypothetical protein